MKAITVLFGGILKKEAFEPLNDMPGVLGKDGKSSFVCCIERAKKFPDTEKVILLGNDGVDYPGFTESSDLAIIRAKNWNRKLLLETLSRVQAGYEILFFAWADCPFLDPALAAAMAKRHTQYAAEYTYADGFPNGFAPELLSPGTAGILFNIDKEEDVPVTRDSLFQVIQKDINAFDIETEISPVDLRPLRLGLATDSKRNLLLINRWLKASNNISSSEKSSNNDAGWPIAMNAADLVNNHPEILRTLPSYYNIQVCESCPQNCSYCPWPGISKTGSASMPPDKFSGILDKIIKFSGDAVISLSLWGELALHPQKAELIKMVLERPSLSLIIETSGVGWKPGELESIAAFAAGMPRRSGALLETPLSWIVSLDAFDSNRYREIRGPGFPEAAACVKQLQSLSACVYVQAVRFKGAEDDIEAFYRYWKDAISANRVIIQKYDHFCGKLPRLQASDLSPVKRRPCWHLMRDVCIGLDGSILRCREDLDNGSGRLNIFANSLAEIWDGHAGLYLEHSKGSYPVECADCDEYYTYNF